MRLKKLLFRIWSLHVKSNVKIEEKQQDFLVYIKEQLLVGKMDIPVGLD